MQKQKVHMCVYVCAYLCLLFFVLLLELPKSNLKCSTRVWRGCIISLHNSKNTTVGSRLLQSLRRSYFQDMKWFIWNNMMWEKLLRILKDDRVFFKLHELWWRCHLKDSWKPTCKRSLDHHWECICFLVVFE